MKYTEWLIENYPELESESSVKIFNYVKQAKKDTRSLRMFIASLYFIVVMLFVYSLGYFFGRFTEVEVGIVIAAGISILVSSTVDKRTKQKNIQNKLTELVGKNG